jgi:hypothetical protein
MQVPDAIEPAVGYRVWEVKGDRLYSVVHEQLWEPDKPFEAFCDNPEHEVPEPKCACGVYAALTFARLFEMGYTKTTGLFGAPYGQVTIAGQVNLWGGVIPGRLGWRAQFAYPRKLLIPYTLWKLAMPLKAAYGVPYQLYNLERVH